MIKLEGGAAQLEAIRQLASQGIPVCGHLGLLPQSVHKLGGYRVQGREQRDASLIREDARLLQEAGVDMLVLECVPDQLAAQVTHELTIPVIGIGAGPDCDGQVLVLYEMLGINPNPPRFVKNFLQSGRTIQEALNAYVDEVRAGDFPTVEHSFR
jgi:3-methyl-2-oxobutanoate hydroxymethyltransferase